MNVDEFIAHYGVKGMKWGVRKPRNEAARAAQYGPSKDSKTAQRALKKATTSGVKALSNNELKDLNNRLQLEQSYARLVPQKRTALQTGQAFAKELLGIGNTANQAIAFSNSPAGGLIKETLRKK